MDDYEPYTGRGRISIVAAAMVALMALGMILYCAAWFSAPAEVGGGRQQQQIEETADGG